MTSALVVGAGSIGQRHATNLRALGVESISMVDPDADRLARACAAIGVTAAASYGRALAARPDVVLVCSPPVFHVDQARAAVDAGAHVFVEKPLGATLVGVDDLLAAAAAARRTLQVGYNLHFHPAVRTLKSLVDTGAVGRILWGRAEFGQYLPDWRPQQDYRAGYTARRSLGGGIILDASHELAYLLWLLGTPSKVTCVAGHVSELDTDTEDCASLILEFPQGTLADVHLDYVQRTYSRSCRLAGTDGTIEWSLRDGVVRVARPDDEVEMIDVPTAVDDTYVDELRHFLDCVRTGATPLVDGGLGRSVLEVVTAAHRSSSSNEVAALP